MKKLTKTFGSDLEHLPVFNALCGDNPEQSAGTVHATNPEHLPVFKAPRGTIRNRTRGRDDPCVQSGPPPWLKALCRADPEQNKGTIYASNTEYLFIFTDLDGADPEQNSRKINASNSEHFLAFKAPRDNDSEQNIRTQGRGMCPIRNTSLGGEGGGAGGPSQWKLQLGLFLSQAQTSTNAEENKSTLQAEWRPFPM